MPSRSLAARSLQQIIERFWSGSAEQFLAGMVDEKVLTPAQIRKLAERLAAEPARTKRFEASRDMTPDQADVLEERFVNNPDDWDARERLVTYYGSGRAVPGPGRFRASVATHSG